MKNPEKKKAASGAPEPRVGPGDYSANPRTALNVPAECGGQRLDQILARLLAQHSRSRLQGWIRAGRVAVGGTTVLEPRQRLWAGETIELAEAADERAEASTPEDIPLQVVHEDESLLVIDKPAGLVVHPGSGNWSGTLLNALLHRWPELGRLPRAGIVHRLDKDTSGLLVVARTLEAQTDLVRQLQARSVRRHYQALARGRVESSGTVDAPIGRHPTQRTRMAVVSTGKAARTHYRVLERFVDCSLIECALESGRTHQIRVHMTAAGYPLVGDPTYGSGVSRLPKGPPFSRQALHACRLALRHPLRGEVMQWRSDLPADMAELLYDLRRQAALAADQAAADEVPVDDGDEATWQEEAEALLADDDDEFAAVEDEDEDEDGDLLAP
ncbi:MAG: Ribosomal large subunit pseudouridine synthase D [Candidatus Accumulibacter adjunctus]|uniref:Pseudouridine synthase n=1 Tax=Candidatus Accumulibacter adjunctus TaxID=1454001 RepID=A0A011MSR5_9PROT|nr:MAG: Ribosomal large subunit pseudouridine synthase D [Candidatus Accumulibacter adjunctus]